MTSSGFVLIGVPVKNCARYISQAVDQILKLTYPKDLITIVFLESDSDDDTWIFLNGGIKPRLDVAGYRAVHVVKRDFDFKLPHSSRHVPDIQRERGRVIGEARQSIIDWFLKDNEFVFWIDADLETIPCDYINSMIALNVDLAAPVVITPNGEAYALGSYLVIDGKKLNRVELAALYPDLNLIPLDRCDAWFIRREVFDEDVNTHNVKDKYELLVFSDRAKAKGFKVWLASKIVVIHQDIPSLEKLEKSKV